jgi:hypothetical protein
MLPNLPGNTTTLPMRTNTAVAAPVAKNSYYDLVVDGDLAKLTPDQRVQFLKNVTESLGLNPMTRPFGLIKLDNKVTLYALKEASTQLAKRDNVSVKLGDYVYIKDRNMLMVSVTASSPDGRSTDDVAAIPLGEKVGGEAAANSYMKLATKAKRRAILTHCGLGILDESELETCNNVRRLDDEPQKTIDIVKEPARVICNDTKVQGMEVNALQSERPPNTTLESHANGTNLATPERSQTGFDYNSNDDRQWLIDAVKNTFPKIMRADALAICSTFAKADSKIAISSILAKRLEVELANKAAGKPSIIKD